MDGMTAENCGTWDREAQTFHGGQDWKFLQNFVEDFSVTTNGLGTPEQPLKAARESVDTIHHYPPSDMEPAVSDLALYLWPDKPVVDNDSKIQSQCDSDKDWKAYKDLLLLGNGASELIDLVIRNSKHRVESYFEAKNADKKPKFIWSPGPQQAQYKEYARSATAAGFETAEAGAGATAGTSADADADALPYLHCIVNPTNPTGDYWQLKDIRAYIEKLTANYDQLFPATGASSGASSGDNGGGGSDGSGGCHRFPPVCVLVDESMQPWLGPHWREDSLIGGGYNYKDSTDMPPLSRGWVVEMLRRFNVHVYVITSWTKIWSCTGIRLGSIVTPTTHHATALKKIQVPWSVNNMALAFLSAVTKLDTIPPPPPPPPTTTTSTAAAVATAEPATKKQKTSEGKGEEEGGGSCYRESLYMQETWSKTREWNHYLRRALKEQCPQWAVETPPENDFLSWVWVNTGSERVAEMSVEGAKRAGVPVRWGKPGYNLPTYIRLAVRAQDKVDILLGALKVAYNSGEK